MMNIESIKKLIRDVPDFPKTGVLFKDITPVLSDADAFRSLINHLCELVPKEATKIVAVESRGFILGAAMAQVLGLGLVLVRKPGKLPHKILSHTYELEYGKDTLNMHEDALNPEEQVTIVDDVLATGGTASAVEILCGLTGAKILNHVFMMELGFLSGRKKLKARSDSLILL